MQLFRGIKFMLIHYDYKYINYSESIFKTKFWKSQNDFQNCENFENTRFQKCKIFERHDFKNTEFLKDTNKVSGTSEWNEVSVNFQKITENPQDFQSLKMLEAFLNYLW